MIRLAKIWFFLIAIFSISFSFALAQSENREAMKWFKVAQKEQNLEKKIDAYMKAIELDPKFVDAFLNLGLEFKKKQDFVIAEKYIRKAYTVKLISLSNSTKSRILYELATTYKRLGKIKPCEDALRGAKQLTTNQDLKNQISLQLGEILFQQERFQAAFIELNQGLKKNIKNRAYYAKLIKSVENSIKLEGLYHKAKEAELKGNPQKAKAILEQIHKKNPGFKNVEEKISELELLLQKKAGGVSEVDQKETANKSFAVESRKKNAIPQETTVEVKKSEQAHDNAQQPATNGNIKQGKPRTRTLILAHKSNEVEEKISKVDFRGTIEKETLREDFRPAQKTRNESALESNTDIKPVDLKERQRRKTPSKKIQESVNQKIKESKKNSLTDDKAKLANFNTRTKITEIHSSNKDTGNTSQQRLKPNNNDIIDSDDLKNPQEIVNRPEFEKDDSPFIPNFFFISGILTAFLLPVVVFVVISPTARARFYILIHKYEQGAQIYENMLAKHPNMLWLYPALAKIYDICDRHDKRAMEVYTFIQQLNSNTKQSTNLNTIIAYKYLSAEPVEQVTIEVLENDTTRAGG